MLNPLKVYIKETAHNQVGERRSNNFKKLKEAVNDTTQNLIISNIQTAFGIISRLKNVKNNLLGSSKASVTSLPAPQAVVKS